MSLYVSFLSCLSRHQHRLTSPAVAEKIFRALRKAAAANPDVDFIAVSHSNQQSTDEWVSALGGTSEEGSSHGVRVVVDDTRKSHAKWGLGISSVWHVLSPGGMRNLFKLGREEGIWNRPTSSGSRWQTAGSFAVDAEGVVRWSRAAGRADEMPDFGEGVRMASKADGTKSKL